jgi:hypothetical protein
MCPKSAGMQAQPILRAGSAVQTQGAAGSGLPVPRTPDVRCVVGAAGSGLPVSHRRTLATSWVPQARGGPCHLAGRSLRASCPPVAPCQLASASCLRSLARPARLARATPSRPTVRRGRSAFGNPLQIRLNERCAPPRARARPPGGAAAGRRPGKAAGGMDAPAAVKPVRPPGGGPASPPGPGMARRACSWRPGKAAGGMDAPAAVKPVRPPGGGPEVLRGPWMAAKH